LPQPAGIFCFTKDLTPFILKTVPFKKKVPPFKKVATFRLFGGLNLINQLNPIAMIIIENNAAMLNEIVFKNRNKNYGAYAIRSEYGNTIIKSLGATILFFASISALALWLSNTVVEDKKIDIDGNIVPMVDLYKVEVDVTPLQRTEPAATRHPAASTPNTPEVSTNINDHAVEPINTPVQTPESTSGTGSQTGTSDVLPGGATGNNPAGTGDGPDVGPANPTSEPVLAPDVPPSFENIGAFIQKNLKYPTFALESNVSGRVIITFVIDEEGKIISASLLKGIGYGCDEEALRVVKLMPKWKPGMVKGKPVKVSFNLPIVFKLQ
jgi:protein TonB